jgi:hypothetical protein
VKTVGFLVVPASLKYQNSILTLLFMENSERRLGGMKNNGLAEYLARIFCDWKIALSIVV